MSGNAVCTRPRRINLSLGRRFERIVTAHATRLAIRTPSREVSYGDLNRGANRIADALLRRRTEPESVATILGNDIAQATAFLGVLKAGRRFVPIDPTHPYERARFVFDDAQARWLLTDNRHLPIARTICTSGVQLLNLDELDSSFSDENPTDDVPLDAHTWIVYTSGTTGAPKGVLQTHRNLLYYLRLYAEGFRLSPDDCLTTLFPFTVNGSLHDIVLTLLTGATLSPWDAKTHGVSGLASWLTAQGTTIYSSVPTAYRQFIATLKDDDEFPSLRVVRLWGERSYRRDFEAFQKHFADHCELVNRIGASETGPVSWQFFRKDSVFEGNSLPVGYPTEGHEVILVDEAGQEAPLGEVGEIVVRSRYLSPGYWRRDEQTRSLFTQDPIDAEMRLYHTGDVARMLPDGCMVPMGRKDHQVKIRGYRIELDEIEGALVAIEGIDDALVAVVWDHPDEGRLVAYFVAAAATSPGISAIRRALASRLPDYLIPSTFVRLDAFPLAPNGKVARKALPAPGRQRPKIDTTYAPAETAEQRRLVRIWEEVLRLDEVGVDDPFLDLGGDSLLAADIASRVLREFAVDLPLQTVLAAASVRSMAATIAVSRSDVAIITRHRSPNRAPLSFAQRGLWLLDQIDPLSSVYNIPVAFRLSGPLDVGALHTSLERITERHEALRTRIVPAAVEPFQQIDDNASVEFAHIDLTFMEPTLREAEALRLARIEAERPFDLSAAQKMRVALFRLSAEDHVLGVTIHHIAGDGWSFGVLAHELGQTYSALRSSKSPALDELPVRYVDYSLWQREVLAGAALQKATEYWKRRLEGSPPLLQLPLDRPRPPRVANRGGRLEIALPSEKIEKYMALARGGDVTLFMVLLGAYVALLSRLTGETDIPVGVPVSGRNRVELEGLIGCFVNTLVLRNTWRGDPTFRQLLTRVRDTTVEALKHQELPFEVLVETLRPKRTLSRTPLFQVMFVLRPARPITPLLEGLLVSRIPLHNGTSKFDLTTSLAKRAETLEGWMEYDTTLFDDSTIACWADGYVSLLSAALDNPELPLSSLPLVSRDKSSA